MSADSNIKTIQAIYAAFGRGDVPAILEMLAENVRWGVQSHSAAAAGVPWHEQLSGRGQVPKFFAALAANADFTRFEPHAFVADDEHVYCTVSWAATNKPNGKKMEQRVMHRFTFKNGRITEWVGTEDTALSAETLS